jgi:hypothetical protein
VLVRARPPAGNRSDQTARCSLMTLHALSVKGHTTIRSWQSKVPLPASRLGQAGATPGQLVEEAGLLHERRPLLPS